MNLRATSRSLLAVVSLMALTVGLTPQGGRATPPSPEQGSPEGPLPFWDARYDGPASGPDNARALGVSPQGDAVFVTGGSLGEGTSLDYATLAYDAVTGEELWEARYDGPAGSYDAARALGVSPEGDAVFVTGESTGVDSIRDYATLAYDAATGEELWEARYQGPASHINTAWALGVSPHGDVVFVTGQSTGEGTGQDYATLAYDAATGEELWEARYDGPASDRDNAFALGVGPEGDAVFVTGLSTGEGTGVDYATLAYDAATGEELWEARYDGPASGHDAATALGVGPEGDAVFVTGESVGQGTGQDYATLAYDAATGEQLWEARYDGPASAWDIAWALGVGPEGDAVFVTGGSTGEGTGQDYATLAYDAATGEELWEARYDGPASALDSAFALEVSPAGDAVVVTGESTGVQRVLDAGSVLAVDGTSADYATLAYDAATGEQLWEARYDGPAGSWDTAFALGVRPQGDAVFVTGASPGETATADFATVAYSLQTCPEGPGRFAYEGPTSAIRGETVTLSATLANLALLYRGDEPPDDLPVSGRVLRFDVGGFEAAAITDEAGVATVEMPVDQPYGGNRLRVSFAGDENDQLAPTEVACLFAVLWEHEFADRKPRKRPGLLRVNTITGELQFTAPGDVSDVKTDPDMRVDTLPTDETMISINYTDDDLTVVARFLLERETFAATVRTPSHIYVLTAP